ncbi:MAG: anaerobic ribonucleoside-triphosphate reductase activating protein [Peptococcaceae bacterium]|nr:anaerobic ribonucleoside-triphosphate reductase activating protein [Peptococcaceae bacterium]
MTKTAETCFRGLQKTTLLDYPGHLACVFFTGGCSFRCVYCYNCSLVNKSEPELAWDSVWSLLERRKGLLEGVCISGGEPMLAPFLPDFLRRVKDQGFKVKLDTNGYHPEALKQLVEQKLLDFVAMDIKNTPAKYAETCGMGLIDIGSVKASADIIRDSGLDYEFRTTVSMELFDEDSFTDIVSYFGNGKRYALQPVRQNLPTLSGKRFIPPTPDILELWAYSLEGHYDEVVLHGI